MEKKRRRGKESRRGRGREEEEEKKRRQDQKGMELLNLSMDIWFCMIIILPKPRVLLGFHLNPKIMESKVGKTLNSTIRI